MLKCWNFKLILCLIIFNSCVSRVSTPVSELNLHNGKTGEKQVSLSKVADSIRYITLKTPDDTYLSYNLDVNFSENHLLILDKTTRSIYLFSPDGNYINTIGSLGEGPTEYLFPVDCTINEKEKKVYVLDSQKRIVLVFNLNAQFERYFPIIGYPQTLYFHHNNLVFIIPNEGKGVNDFPNIYKTDLDGKLISSIKFDNTIVQNRFATFSSYLYKDTVVFWQQGSDTIYNIPHDFKVSPRRVIVDNDLMPPEILLTEERNNRLSGFLVLHDILESENFIFVDALHKLKGLTIVHNKKDNDNFNLVYDYDVFDHGYINDLDAGPPFIPRYQINEKAFYNLLSPRIFLKTYNDPYTRKIDPLDKNLHKKVAELAKNLQQEGNPILQIAYFK